VIKGVFFDVGGTLYSYRKLPSAQAEVLQELAEKFELQHSAADLAQHYRSANKEVDLRYADKPGYLFREYFRDIYTDFLGRLDQTHQLHRFDWFDELQRDKLVGQLELQADCHSTLEELKAMGLYLSAVSNADDNQLAPLIERGQLQRWLTHWSSSEEAQSCKPDQRFFQLALKKSGLTPDQVVFVGDSLEQDIQGAHTAGMTTVLITESGIPTPMHIGREVPDPNYRITRLSELPDILRRLI
jgi:HAD superfamily hydrolase (TIGR01509 family)